MVSEVGSAGASMLIKFDTIKVLTKSTFRRRYLTSHPPKRSELLPQQGTETSDAPLGPYLPRSSVRFAVNHRCSGSIDAVSLP